MEYIRYLDLASYKHSGNVLYFAKPLDFRVIVVYFNLTRIFQYTNQIYIVL